MEAIKDAKKISKNENLVEKLQTELRNSIPEAPKFEEVQLPTDRQSPTDVKEVISSDTPPISTPPIHTLTQSSIATTDETCEDTDVVHSTPSQPGDCVEAAECEEALDALEPSSDLLPSAPDIDTQLTLDLCRVSPHTGTGVAETHSTHSTAPATHVRVSLSDGPFLLPGDWRDSVNHATACHYIDTQQCTIYSTHELSTLRGRLDECFAPLRTCADRHISSHMYSGDPNDLDDLNDLNDLGDHLDRLISDYTQQQTRADCSAHTLRATLHEIAKYSATYWTVTTGCARNSSLCADNVLLHAERIHQMACVCQPAVRCLHTRLEALPHQLSARVAQLFALCVTRARVWRHLHSHVISAAGCGRVQVNCSRVYACEAQRRACARVRRALVTVLAAVGRMTGDDAPLHSCVCDWVTCLCAALYCDGVLADFEFVLLHLLRTPPQWLERQSSWCLPLVQVPAFSSSLAVEHFINLIDLLFSRIEPIVPPTASEDISDTDWISLDDPDVTNKKLSDCGELLHEDDILCVLTQLPWERFLFYLRQKMISGDGRDVFGAISSAHLVLLSLARGLYKYSTPHHQQLCKRICHHFLEIVLLVCDVLETNCKPLFENELYKDRLMLERKVFLIGSLKLLLMSSASVWSFISSYPFTQLSNTTVWACFWYIHSTDVTQALDNGVGFDLSLPKNIHEMSNLLLSMNVNSKFVHRVALMSQSDMYFCLETLTALVLARDMDSNRLLVQTVVHNFMLISFLSHSTRELCHRAGADHLSRICAVHDHAMSVILSVVNKHLLEIGEVAMFLFRELPLHLWRLEAEDLELIGAWLAATQLTSLEHRLARLILTRLSWERSSDQSLYHSPHISLTLHRRAALCVLHTFLSRCVSAYEGSLANETRRYIHSMLNTVTQTPLQTFHEWCWTMLSRFRLHAIDGPLAKAVECLQNPAAAFSDIPPHDSSEFSTLASRCDTHALLSYFFLLATSRGHSMPLLCEHLGAQMRLILESGAYLHGLHVLQLVVPLFLTVPHKLTQTVLSPIISAIISMDCANQGYVSKAFSSKYEFGPMLNCLNSSIEDSLLNFNKFAMKSCADLLKLWLVILFGVEQFHMSPAVLFLLDNLLRSAFLLGNDFVASIIHMFVKFLESMNLQSRSSKLSRLHASNLFNWWPSHTYTPLLDYSLVYLSWFYLSAYSSLESSSGLWHDFICDLCENPNLSISATFKNVASRRMVVNINQEDLSIYMWANACLCVPKQSPIYLMFWFRFFRLYLFRVFDSSSVERPCLGRRFFRDKPFSHTFELLTRRVEDFITFNQTRHSSAVAAADIQSIQFQERCWDVSKSLRRWLNEPCLLLPGLRFDALDEGFMPHYLRAVIACDSVCVLDDWIVRADVEALSVACCGLWRQKFPGYSAVPSRTASATQELTQAVAKQSYSRVRKRFRNMDCSVLELQLPVSGTPSLDEHYETLVDTDKFDAVSEKYLKSIRSFCTDFAHHFDTVDRLNCQLTDYLSGLYTSRWSCVMEKAYCQGTVVSHEFSPCAGPAVIVLEFEESTCDTMIEQDIELNKREFLSSVDWFEQSVSHSLVTAMLFFQNFSNHVISQHKRCDKQESSRWMDLGLKLFYKLSSTLFNSISQTPLFPDFLTIISDLGKVFVSDNPGECLPLLNTIIDENLSHSTMLHLFCPNTAKDYAFVDLYAMTCKLACDNITLCISLLEKFDFTVWFQHAPHSPCVVATVLDCLLDSLSRHVTSGDSSVHSIQFCSALERHVGCIVTHDAHAISRRVTQLFGAMRDGYLPVNIAYSLCSPDVRAVLCGLRVCEIIEFGQAVLSFFNDVLNESPQISLYSKFEAYVQSLSKFFSLLVVSTQHVYQSQYESYTNYKQDPINFSHSLFTNWIYPRPGGSDLVSPWSDADITSSHVVSHMLSAYTDLIISETLAPHSGEMLRQLWSAYVSAWAPYSGRDVAARDLFHSHILCSSLPWSQLPLSAVVCSQIVAILHSYSPDSHSFVAKIVVSLNWGDYERKLSAENYVYQQYSTFISQFLDIIVRISLEPDIRQSGKLFLLVSRAECYDWHHLSSEQFNDIISWFVMSVDPLCVLSGENQEPVDAALLSLVRSVCAVSVLRDTCSRDKRVAARADVQKLDRKVVHYVRVVVRLLLQAMFKHGATMFTQNSGDAVAQCLCDLMWDLFAISRHECSLVCTESDGFDSSLLADAVSEFLVCASSESNKDFRCIFFRIVTENITEDSDIPLVLAFVVHASKWIKDADILAPLLESLLVVLYRADAEQFRRRSASVTLPLDNTELMKSILGAATNGKCILLLYAYLLIVPKHEEITHAKLVMSLLDDIAAKLSTADETKIYLLINYFFECLLNLAAHTGESLPLHIGRLSCDFAKFCKRFCLESSGVTYSFLTNIGLIRRASFTRRFRAMTALLSACLLSRVTSDMRYVEGQQKENSHLFSVRSRNGRWTLLKGLSDEFYVMFENLQLLAAKQECRMYQGTIEEVTGDICSDACNIHYTYYLLMRFFHIYWESDFHI